MRQTQGSNEVFRFKQFESNGEERMTDSCTSLSSKTTVVRKPIAYHKMRFLVNV